MFVVSLVHAEHIPLFLQISMLVRTDKWLLCGRLYYATQFDEHRHAYKVQQGENFVCYAGNELDFQALDMYTVESGDNYVAMRYGVMKS